MDKMDKYELHAYILINWEQEWDYDTRYFVILPNGDILGYDFETNTFYLNHYLNKINYEETVQILKALA